MDKKQLHHSWRRWRHVRPWYFLALAGISLIVAGFALRANNLRMVQLRNNVYQADRTGGNVEQALQQLRAYVGRHMNTELASGPNAVHPPIQLKYTYDRLTQAQDQASSNASADSSHIYGDAQTYCEKTIPDGFSGSYRLFCIQSYVDQHKGLDPGDEPAIPKNLYQFDFASPAWSPDLAGWSLVATAVFALAFAVTSVVRVFMKHAVR